MEKTYYLGKLYNNDGEQVYTTKLSADYNSRLKDVVDFLENKLTKENKQEDFSVMEKIIVDEDLLHADKNWIADLTDFYWVGIEELEME